MKTTPQKIGKFIDNQIGVLLLLPLFSHTFSPVLSPNFVLLDIFLLLFARLAEGNLHETVKAKYWVWREPFMLLVAAFMAMIVIHSFFSASLARAIKLGFWNFIIPILFCISVFLLASVDAKVALQKNLRSIIAVFLFTVMCFVSRLYFNIPIDYPLMQLAPTFDPQYDYLYNHGVISLVLMFFPVSLLVSRSSNLTRSKKNLIILLLLITVCIVLILSIDHSARFAFTFGLVVLLFSYLFPRFAIIEFFIFVPVLIFIQPYFGKIIGLIFLDGGFEHFKRTFELRYYIWVVFGDRIWEGFIFGHGIGASEHFDFSYLIRERFRVDIWAGAHSHNNFLQIWYEFGLTGVIIIVAACVEYLRWIAARPIITQPHLLGFLLTAFTIALVSHGLWQAWWVTSFALSGFLLQLSFDPSDLKTSVE